MIYWKIIKTTTSKVQIQFKILNKFLKTLIHWRKKIKSFFSTKKMKINIMCFTYTNGHLLCFKWRCFLSWLLYRYFGEWFCLVYLPLDTIIKIMALLHQCFLLLLEVTVIILFLWSYCSLTFLLIASHLFGDTSGSQWECVLYTAFSIWFTL